ncbi:BRO1-like domain-containing protein [Fennellomyces sp. T-0311]|nr:BRO1-like domain-containing protein [Fennellomyces sp. T-0311]
MAQQQIPFISAPFKRTDDVDWIHPLKYYIANVYQDDPEKYSEETYALNRLRQDIRGAGKDLTGRDLLYRYFGQLELLDLRFPVDEKHIKILFTWYDAFNGRATSQYSLAYEKASVIFNTAATLSAIASVQNRAEAEGRKRAFNFFQASAGMFLYINDNFLHAPSQDLNRDTVKMLTELMLAQAHESFLENSLREKKKDSLVAKLASHAAWVYGSLSDDIQDCIGRGVGVDKSWMIMSQIKQKYYQAVAQQHRAAACELDQNFGEQVSRLAAAEAVAKEASKLAGSNMSLLSSGHALPGDCGSVLQELCKSLAANLAEKHTAAARDNDMIYHDHVPKDAILTPIDRLKAVKPVPISELYGPNEVSKIIGGDIFARLIPLSVHESASMYSEEKAKMVRAESERCDIAKAELNASLEYMKLPKSLEKFKQQHQLGANADNAMLDSFAVPSSDVREWADKISQEESSNNTTVRELIETLDGLKSRAGQMLDQVSLELDQEMQECEKMRVKYGDQWTQKPSGLLTGDFRQDLRNHRDALSSASQSDGQLLRHYDEIAQDVGVLRQGGKSKALETAFTESLAGLFSDKTNGKDASNLLDLEIDVGISSKSMEIKVKRVEDTLDKLRQIENDRRETFEDLKEKTMQDDISQLLILNKKTVNIEQQIFTSELEKFRPHQQRITASIHHQQQVIQELTAAFKAVMDGEEAQKLQKRWDAAERQRRSVLDRFNRAQSGYFETKEGLRKGIQFYSSLCDVIESLMSNARKFTSERAQERESMGETLENERIGKEQELLKEKLSKYTSAAAPKIDTTMSSLADKAREMSIGQHTSFYNAQPTASPITPRSYSTSSQSFASAPPQPTASYSNPPQSPPARSAPPPQPYTSYGSQIPSQQTNVYQQQPTAPPQPPPLQRAPSYSSNSAQYAASPAGASPVPYMFSQSISSAPSIPRQEMYVSSPVAPAPPVNMYGAPPTAPSQQQQQQQQPQQYRYSMPVYPSQSQQQSMPQPSPQQQSMPQPSIQQPSMPQQPSIPQQPLPVSQQQPSMLRQPPVAQQTPMPQQHTMPQSRLPQQSQRQQPPPLPSKPPQMQHQQPQPQQPPAPPASMPSYYPMLSSNVSARPEQTPNIQPPTQQQPYYSTNSQQQPWQQQSRQHPPPPQQPMPGNPAPQQQQQQQTYWQPLNPSNGGGSLLD